MPLERISLQSVSTDRGWDDNPGLVLGENYAQTASGALLMPRIESRDSQSGVAGVRGWVSNPSVGAEGFWFYCAVSSNDGSDSYPSEFYRFKLVSPYAFTNAMSSPATVKVDNENGAVMVVYGQNVLAAVGHDADSLYASGTGTFQTMITNAEPVISSGASATGNWPPRPKYVGVWGSQVVIANMADVGPASALDPDPDLYWLSEFNNANSFSTPHSAPGMGSTYEFARDHYGEITGIVGGGEFGVLMKERCLYRVLFDGPFGHQKQLIYPGIGSYYHSGWVWAGPGELYLMTSAGPARMTRTSFETLGDGRVRRTLVDSKFSVGTDYQIDPTPEFRYGCRAYYSPSADVVTWIYRGANTSPSVARPDGANRALHFCRATGEFTMSKLEPNSDDRSTVAVFDWHRGNHDWNPISGSGVAYYDDLSALHVAETTNPDSPSGAALSPEARWTTSFQVLGPDEGEARISRVRVPIRAGSDPASPGVTVRLYGKNTSLELGGEGTQYASASTFSAQGWADIDTTNYYRLHRLRVEVSGLVKEAPEFVDVDYQVRTTEGWR